MPRSPTASRSCSWAPPVGSTSVRAETHELMEGWMRSISSASYEYITLMVAELQKKLDEITSNASATSRLVEVEEPPTAPPRQRRVNPFHQSEPPPPGLAASFSALHDELGRVIRYDRANWLSCRAPAEQAPLIQL
ncbi:sesquipedalian-1-like [Pollicipes pollicipes]|uniref:sesquipedalian-1-like n=1 Tax=Pollicipes pollicipes TaxID=41117 RepID=UPI0018858B06|nr:sesquipedalian-1-like [Pollicipes pollicipes]